MTRKPSTSRVAALSATAAMLLGDEPAAAPDLLDANRPFYRIGEVAKLLGVEQHVLRYWEQEFPEVRPQKSSGRQRVYTRDNVATLLKIKHLVYERRFTLAGARAELAGRSQDVSAALPQPGFRLGQSLARVREELEQLAALVRGPLPPRHAADPMVYVDPASSRGRKGAGGPS